MKVLLIADSEELRRFLENELAPRGAVLSHYWHPIKAMDNVDETAPDMVIFSGRDFPRHWKPFLVYFRAYSSRAEKIPFILLRGENFSEDEQKKADYLHVTAVISEFFDSPDDLRKLKEFLTPGRGAAYRPSAAEKAAVLFAHPETLGLIQGRIVEISSAALSFSILSPESRESLVMPCLIYGCSLNIFGTLIAVDFEITGRTDDVFHARIFSGHDEIAAHI